jgi:hypothetical protein
MNSCRALVVKPGVFTLLHAASYFFFVGQLAAISSVPSGFDLVRDMVTVRGEPCLLLVEKTDSVFYELIDGLVGAALNVLPDLLFQLGAEMDIHEQ